jgi:hypothetical protein
LLVFFPSLHALMALDNDAMVPERRLCRENEVSGS